MNLATLISAVVAATGLMGLGWRAIALMGTMVARLTAIERALEERDKLDKERYENWMARIGSIEGRLETIERVPPS